MRRIVASAVMFPGVMGADDSKIYGACIYDFGQHWRRPGLPRGPNLTDV